jgi:hypothetical protein
MLLLLTHSKLKLAIEMFLSLTVLESLFFVSLSRVDYGECLSLNLSILISFLAFPRSIFLFSLSLSLSLFGPSDPLLSILESPPVIVVQSPLFHLGSCKSFKLSEINNISIGEVFTM